MPIRVIASASATSGTTTSKIKPVRMLSGNRRSTAWATSHDPRIPTDVSSHADFLSCSEEVAPDADLLWNRDLLGRDDHVDADRADDVDRLPRRPDGSADNAADPHILTGSQHPASYFAADG